MRIALLLLAGLMLCLPLTAHAKPEAKSIPVKQPIKHLGTFGTWATFHYSDDGQDVCYMLQRPQKSGVKPVKGAAQKRGDILFMVTLRPSENVGPIVSYESGYTFRSNSEAKVTVDGTSYWLFTDKDTAWARTGATDRAITNALRKGKNLVVQGTSKQGSKSADQFALAGSERSYKTIAKACGIAP